MSVLAAARTAVDVSFALYGEDGTFTAPSAAPVACKAILSRHDPVIDLGALETAVRSPGLKAVLRKSEIATRPPAGSTLVIAAGAFAGTYTLQDAAEDAERLCWEADAA